MKKIADILLNTVLIFTLGLMAVIVAANVFSRFVLNHSIFWADELTLVLFVWLTFLGAAVGIREQSHYTFGYLVHRLPPHTLHYYQIAGDVITLVAILILGYYSLLVTVQINIWIMPALEISRSLVYGAAPAGCAFMAYYVVLRLLDRLRTGPERRFP